MNNQVILSALQSQLATKKDELHSYETTTSEPAFKAISDEVLTSLRENVSTLIPKITLSDSRIEIMKSSQPNSGWSAMTIYLDSNFRRSDSDTKQQFFAKINWYGSSATTEDQNSLNDLQIFGAVAAKLSWIEYEFINNWRPRLIEINKPCDDMRAEIYHIEHSIRTIEHKITQEGISKYKQVGFSCTIIPTLNIEVDWDDENRPYILKETIANIKLSIGRSRWDYVYAKSFKILKTNKYKTTLEVTLGDNRIVEYTVSAKSFDNFIEQVYNWQTNFADKHNDKMTEKFNNNYATKKSV
jgi:hypothetical protein